MRYRTRLRMPGHRAARLASGAISPADAANQIFPTAKIRSGAGHNQAVWNSLQLAAQDGQMVGAAGEVAYIPGTVDCAAAAGVPTGWQNDMKLVQVGSGLALQGVNMGLQAAGAALGPVTAGISIAVSAIVGLFSTLVNHHAQAVKAEQSTLCSAVPAANNYLKIIDQAVQSGLATPQDGITALDSLVSDFRSKVGSIIQGSDPASSGECNAACVMLSELRAIVALKQSQYQDLIAGAAQVVTAGGPNVSSPSGVIAPASSYSSFYSPSTTAAPQSTASGASGDWLPIAALIIGGFFLLRSI